MATAKQKKETLNEWASCFPRYYKWGNNFLIQRRGPLLSGVCLEARRDPSIYKPIFFFHDLLVPFPVISLSYSLTLTSRGVYKPLKYERFNVSDVDEFKGQAELLNKDISFELFFKHVVGLGRGERVASQGVYLPHLFRDIVMLGSYFGDKEYYLTTLDNCAEVIRAKPEINLGIIGTVGDWVSAMRAAVRQDLSELLDKEIKRHGLEGLEDLGMVYERVPDYWTFFE